MEIKKYNRLVKKIHEVGFDEFYQAGSPNMFHEVNIVARSKAINKIFWFCVDGGYCSKKTFYIVYRDLDNMKSKDTRIYCKNQTDMIEKINNIKLEIEKQE